MNGLQDKAAIVTGGGTGIGRGIALALARQGSHVLVTGRRPEPLQQVMRATQGLAGSVLALPGDVSDPVHARSVVERAKDEFGRLDILVNNAGISGGARIHEHPIDAWSRTLAVNLNGPFLMCRYALPIIRAAGGGHIVNISSESGLEYYRGSGAYGVSKHALNALGEYVQRENQDYNIRVDTICPGMVVTEMTQESPGLDHAKCLYPEDIADLVLFLLTRRPNIKIGTPILIQTMLNPWE